MKVASPRATAFAPSATFILRRDRERAPMARRGPHKTMKVPAVGGIIVPSRDRNGAAVAGSRKLTFNVAHLPLPILLPLARAVLSAPRSMSFNGAAVTRPGRSVFDRANFPRPRPPTFVSAVLNPPESTNFNGVRDARCSSCEPERNRRAIPSSDCTGAAVKAQTQQLTERFHQRPFPNCSPSIVRGGLDLPCDGDDRSW